MDLNTTLNELRDERERIDRAIMDLLKGTKAQRRAPTLQREQNASELIRRRKNLQRKVDQAPATRAR